MTSSASRRTVGFWVVVAVLGAFMIAASALTPLYAVYGLRWGFGPTTLTAVFGIYVLALLASLLLLGSLSDAVGRRPVLLGSLIVEIVAMVVFRGADGVPELYVGRTLQGLATGAAAATLSAAMIDLQPARPAGLGALMNSVVPTLGLALGALGAGALVQHGGHSTDVVFGALVALFVLCGLALAVVPETVTRGSGRWTPARVGVDRSVRPAFLAALPCLVATWALGGLYLSLGPSILLLLADSTDRLYGTLGVVLLNGAGALACVLVRRREPARAMIGGCAVLVAGLVPTVVAIAVNSAGLFLVGCAVAGLGFGAAFFGAFRTLVALAPPTARGRLVSSVFLASYTAFSLPAVLAGVAATHVGLRPAALVYASAVGLLGLVAVPVTVRVLAAERSDGRARVTESPVPPGVSRRVTRLW